MAPVSHRSQPAHHQTPASFLNVPNPPPRLALGYPDTATVSDPETFDPPQSILPKLFTTLAERYAARTGGYTRVHKFGRRPGDNAPNAIVCLVDGPRDLKFEMVARTVGKETAQSGGVERREEAVDSWEGLEERTRRAVGQVLKYRGDEGKKALQDKARDFAVSHHLSSSSPVRVPDILPGHAICRGEGVRRAPPTERRVQRSPGERDPTVRLSFPSLPPLPQLTRGAGWWLLWSGGSILRASGCRGCRWRTRDWGWPEGRWGGDRGGGKRRIGRRGSLGRLGRLWRTGEHDCRDGLCTSHFVGKEMGPGLTPMSFPQLTSSQ